MATSPVSPKSGKSNSAAATSKFLLSMSGKKINHKPIPSLLKRAQSHDDLVTAVSALTALQTPQIGASPQKPTKRRYSKRLRSNSTATDTTDTTDNWISTTVAQSDDTVFSTPPPPPIPEQSPSQQVTSDDPKQISVIVNELADIKSPANTSQLHPKNPGTPKLPQCRKLKSDEGPDAEALLLRMEMENSQNSQESFEPSQSVAELENGRKLLPDPRSTTFKHDSTNTNANCSNDSTAKLICRPSALNTEAALTTLSRPVKKNAAAAKTNKKRLRRTKAQRRISSPTNDTNQNSDDDDGDGGVENGVAADNVSIEMASTDVDNVTMAIALSGFAAAPPIKRQRQLVARDSTLATDAVLSDLLQSQGDIPCESLNCHDTAIPDMLEIVKGTYPTGVEIGNIYTIKVRYSTSLALGVATLVVSVKDKGPEGAFYLVPTQRIPLERQTGELEVTLDTMLTSLPRLYNPKLIMYITSGTYSDRVSNDMVDLTAIPETDAPTPSPFTMTQVPSNVSAIELALGNNYNNHNDHHNDGNKVESQPSISGASFSVPTATSRMVKRKRTLQMRDSTMATETLLTDIDINLSREPSLSIATVLDTASLGINSNGSSFNSLLNNTNTDTDNQVDGGKNKDPNKQLNMLPNLL